MEKKVLATIKDVFYGIEDHGIFTCYIRLDMAGLTQSFGGLFLDKEKKGPAFYQQLCNTFGVTKLPELIGKKCFALYCFGKLSETIEGLETLDERRFTLTKFSKKFDSKTKTRLEMQEEHLKNEIIQLQEHIKRKRAELKGLKKTYTDWELK